MAVQLLCPAPRECWPVRQLLFVGITLVVCLSFAQADTMTYSNSASFFSAIGTNLTDSYSEAGYAAFEIDNTGFALMTNAQMDAVFGETTYVTTEFPNNNIVNNVGTPSAYYCAGCNGSFILGFTSTTIGNAKGVFGVGFDVEGFTNPNEYAYVTFGDGSTNNYLLTPGGYFGITSTLEINSIAVGLMNGGLTDQLVGITDLTIGATPLAAVPEPASLVLLVAAIACVGSKLRKA